MGTFVPYDATGRAVNLNTEYMYRDDGLRLKVLRFEYYKSDDVDYNWFILAPIDSSNAIKADRYKVSDLYVDCPANANVNGAIQDLYVLFDKLVRLDTNLVCNCSLDKSIYDNLAQFEVNLQSIIKKLENADAE